MCQVAAGKGHTPARLQVARVQLQEDSGSGHARSCVSVAVQLRPVVSAGQETLFLAQKVRSKKKAAFRFAVLVRRPSS